jgi:hypothetical protein
MIMSTTRTTTGAAETAKAVAAEARERIRAEGERAVHAARENTEAFASERRDFAANYLDDVSDALGSAESTLSERGRSDTARMVHKTAGEVQHLADRVHGQDVGRLISEVETFARTRPALFFGGAFILGFALTRLLTLPGGSSETGEESGIGDRGLTEAYGRGSV